MASLEGKVAVVTGASRGIGAAVARALAEQGVGLGLGSRSGDDLGLDNAVGVRCDVRDSAQVDALVASTVARFGRLDILVANAGVGSYGPFLELPPDQVEEMIDVVRAGRPHAGPRSRAPRTRRALHERLPRRRRHRFRDGPR